MPYYFPYYNHKNIARTQKDTISELLHSGDWLPSESITKSFSVKIDTGWVDYNSEYIVYVYKKKDSSEKSKVGKGLEKELDNELSGDDLDIPGAELDDDMENIGSEDEENNYYSLGGDDHDDLEEDQGD